MSLESKIDALTTAVVALNQNIAALLANAPQAANPTPQVAQAVVPQQQTFAPAPAPVDVPVAPVIPPAPQMPAPPTFMAPVAPAAPAIPFSDTKGLITYMTQAYGALGPEKGAMMQNVLTGLGYANVNDVRPEHFPAVFQQIEALKAQ